MTHSDPLSAVEDLLSVLRRYPEGATVDQILADARREADETIALALFCAGVDVLGGRPRAALRRRLETLARAGIVVWRRDDGLLTRDAKALDTFAVAPRAVPRAVRG